MSAETPQPSVPPTRPYSVYLDEKFYVIDGNDGQVIDLSSSENGVLKSDDQVYQRTTTIKNHQPQKLDRGWIENWSTVKIKNVSADRVLIQLSQEQKNEMAKHVVAIAFSEKDTPDMLIPVGQSVRFLPVDLDQVYVWALNGKTPRVTIMIVPE